MTRAKSRNAFMTLANRRADLSKIGEWEMTVHTRLQDNSIIDSTVYGVLSQLDEYNGRGFDHAFCTNFLSDCFATYIAQVQFVLPNGKRRLYHLYPSVTCNPVGSAAAWQYLTRDEAWTARLINERMVAQLKINPLMRFFFRDYNEEHNDGA